MKPIGIIVAVLFFAPTLLLGQTGGTITVEKPVTNKIVRLGIPKIASRYNGTISKKDLLDSAAIRVEGGIVVSYKAVFIRNGREISFKTNGFKLSERVRTMIASMKSFEKIYFYDITVAVPEGNDRRLPSMVFYIGTQSDPIPANDKMKIFDANLTGGSTFVRSTFCDGERKIDIGSKNFFVSSFHMVLVKGDKETRIKTEGDRITSAMCKAIEKAPNGSKLHFDRIKLSNGKSGKAKADPLTFNL
jgi:hypothetical protein